MQKKLVVGIGVGWFILIAVAVAVSLYGGKDAQQWMKDYGVLIVALLTGMLTSLYLAVTYSQLAASRTSLQLQFGAGVAGPKVQVRQVDLPSPPALRIESAYGYPSEYRKKVLPYDPHSELLESKSIAETTKYEMISLQNTSRQPITEIDLQVKLNHDGESKCFAHRHTETLVPEGSVDFALWPVKDMPKYELAVSGTYTDAVGKFEIKGCKVNR